jgi:hypothetical protein
VRMICGCTIEAPGVAPDSTGCEGARIGSIHWKHSDLVWHPCARTGCRDYRPARMPTANNRWPVCVCGEIAQEHE